MDPVSGLMKHFWFREDIKLRNRYILVPARQSFYLAVGGSFACYHHINTMKTAKDTERAAGRTARDSVRRIQKGIRDFSFLAFHLII